jgi:hypothetical protein
MVLIKPEGIAGMWQAGVARRRLRSAPRRLPLDAKGAAHGPL